MCEKMLAKFLNEHRTHDKDKTHIIMPGGYKDYPGGNCLIPIDEQDELDELLIKTIHIGEPSRPLLNTIIKNIGLIECLPTSNIKPVTLDFEFHYPITVTKKQHKDNHIEYITRLIAFAVYQYLAVSDYEIHILESPKLYKGNYKQKENNKAIETTKDIIRIIIPEVICHIHIQHLIRNCIVRNFVDKDINELKLLNTAEDIIFSTNEWMMYGTAEPGKQPYELKSIANITINTELDDINIVFEHDIDYSISDLLRLYHLNGKETQELQIKPDMAQELKVEISIATRKKVILKKKDVSIYIDDRRPEQICTQKIEAKKLIEIINPRRADDYYEWINMCCILRSISYDDDMYDLFLNFSRKSPNKFDEQACMEQWQTDNQTYTTIDSLYRLVKLDNPKEFEEIRQTTLNEYVEQSLSETTQDIANVIYQMFKYDFVCTSADGKEWFEFKKHRWHKCDNGISLRKKIGNEVLNLYLNVINMYNNMAIAVNTDDSYNSPKENYLFKSKALTDITYKLRDQPFKERLMKECVTMFYKKDWTSKLDSQHMLIGFENGVYDLENNVFRDGRHEDLISLSTHRDYIPNSEIPDDVNDEIKTFLEQIFPVPDVKHFVMKTMSSFLQGTNPDEKFHVWSGVGSNGKSKLLELLEQTLGDYAGKLSVSMLTEKRPSATSANPELARARGRRFCCFQEPDEGTKINIGLLKELTGGDKIICRGLFQESFEMKPQFKLLLCCNHKPKIPPDEDATWRRFLIVEFISKFVEQPKGQYEYKRNNNLSAYKIPIWSQYFITLLINYYYNYKQEGLSPPQEVLDATESYKLETDEYLQFMKECMIIHHGNILKVNDLYLSFKAWYKTNYASEAPSQREFKEHMERKLNQTYTYVGWVGWAIKTLETQLVPNQPLIETIEEEVDEINPNEPSELELDPLEWFDKYTEPGNNDSKVTVSECVARYNSYNHKNLSSQAWSKVVKFKSERIKNDKYYINRKWRNT